MRKIVRGIRRSWVIPLMLSVPGAAAVPAAAAARQQTEPAATRAQITLEEALEIAEERNPALRQARNRTISAAARVRSGWGAFLPRIDASLSLSGSSRRVLTGQDNFGQPVELTEARDFHSSSTSQGIGLSYTVFDGFARMNQLDAARAGSRAASAFVDAEAARIEAMVKRRFYNALSAERLVQLEERLLVSAEERLAATRELLRVARATPGDVLGAEVDLASAQLAVEQARGDVKKARLALREAIGASAQVTLHPVGELPDVFDPARLDADALVARAIRMSPAIRQSLASAAQADATADAAAARRWPTIQFNAGWNRGMGLSSYDALTEFNPRNRSYRFGLSASMPLFSGFDLSASITQAEINAKNAEEQARAARLSIGRQVRSALIDLENAYRSVDLAERAADLSRQRLEMAQERYRLGAITFVQLQQIIDRTAQAERRFVQARLTFANALVTLEEQIGGEV